MNDVVINKVQSIQRCILRAREEYAEAGAEFLLDYTRQDAAILNVIRACETAIDLANYVIRKRKLGIPTKSRESFELLARAGVISRTLAGKLGGMVGFRNVAVHAYQELDLDKTAAVIEYGLDDLLEFADAILDTISADHADPMV
jgi:uncharacterized protein YutE (UPF0331/DUF86 family)